MLRFWPRISYIGDIQVLIHFKARPLFAAWLVAAAICVSTSAHAAPKRPHQLDCENHYERGFCERQAEEKAYTAMQKSYERAVATAAAAQGNGLNVDFKSQIERTQREWKSWAADECDLEAGSIMGTASIVAEPICKERLAKDRANRLDEISSNLDIWAPHPQKE